MVVDRRRTKVAVNSMAEMGIRHGLGGRDKREAIPWMESK